MADQLASESMGVRAARYVMASAAYFCLVGTLAFPGWREDFNDIPTPSVNYSDPLVARTVALIGIVLGVGYLVWELVSQQREGRIRWWLLRVVIAAPMLPIFLFAALFAWLFWFSHTPAVTNWMLTIGSTSLAVLVFTAYLLRASRRKGYPFSGNHGIGLAIGFAILPLGVLSLLGIMNETPLLWREAALGHTGHVRQLIRVGADLNRPSISLFTMTTPLGEAASRGHSETAGLLIQAGADVNKGDPTPLMMAAMKGDVPLIRLLKEKGADVNARSSFGMTPLMYTIRNCDAEGLQALISAGADVNATSPQNQTPLKELLSSSKCSATIEGVLRRAGAHE